MSRLVKGYASDYTANQLQVRRVRRFQERTLVVDWNGALPVGESIGEVIWDCTSPWVTFLSSPAIAEDGRSVSVSVKFNFSGIGHVKATVAAESGTLNYEFRFAVSDAPLYPSATYETFNGPFRVSASAGESEGPVD